MERTQYDTKHEGNKNGGREELEPPVFVRLRTKTPNVIVPAHPVRLPGPTSNSGLPLYTIAAVLFVKNVACHCKYA